MTPQEKANYLLGKMTKDQAIVVVDEIVDELVKTRNRYFQLYIIPFWELVKQELTNA